MPWGISGYVCDCLFMAAAAFLDVIAMASESLEDVSAALWGLLGIISTSFSNGPDMVSDLFQYCLGVVGIVGGWLWAGYGSGRCPNHSRHPVSSY